MTLSPIKKTIEITIVNITMKMEMYNLSFKEVFWDDLVLKNITANVKATKKYVKISIKYPMRSN